MINLIKIQREVARHMAPQGDRVEAEDMLFGVMEEVGEMSRAVFKHRQNIRGFGNRKKYESVLFEESGDVVIFLTQLFEKKGWDLEKAIDLAACKVLSRTFVPGETAAGGGD